MPHALIPSLPILLALSFALPAAAQTDAPAEPATAEEAGNEQGGAENGTEAGMEAPPVADMPETNEPGFQFERFAGGQQTRSANRLLPYPAAVRIPTSVLIEPDAADAYGVFQRGYYLTAMDMALPLAENGDASAQTLVAELFAEGFAIPRDLEAARFWYEQAATNGDPTAQFKYGLMLMSGRNAERDPERGRELMREAADQGHPLAQFNYGQMLVDEHPGNAGLMKALPYFEKSAEQGIADAQYALAQIYINGAGVDEAKRDEARSWLIRAAHAGYDTAQLDMAIWLIDGVGGEIDYERGFQWMERAAKGGNVVAQNKLAHLYVNAIGTRPDPVTAAKWYVLSRRAGLNDPALQDFFRGLTAEEQKQALEAANAFRPAKRRG